MMTCKRIKKLAGILLALPLASMAVAESNEKLARDFESEIRPLLEKRCFKCHGQEKQKGDVDFSRFKEMSQVLDSRGLWRKVLGVVQSYEMPPEGSPELNYDEHQAMMRWLRSLPEAELDCNQLATDRTKNFYRGYVMSRRLTREEYNNTIRDLIGLDLRPGDILPADGSGGEGFDTNGDTLYSSTLSVEKYLEAADMVLEALLPTDKTALSPAQLEARARWLDIAVQRPMDRREAALRVLSRFAANAFRRPVEQEEARDWLPLFDRAQARGGDFETSLRLPMKAILISPHFLFLAEPEPEDKGTQPLGAHPLASRLSYFIWASMPDDELLELASTGELLKDNVYRDQIHRMLADPKAKALGERFALQWLELEGLGSAVRPDRVRYPEFDSELAEAMKHEVVEYFNYIVQADRPLLDLIDGDYTFVNDQLAGLYGLSSVESGAFTKVSLNDKHRGGLVGMAGVHAATSYPLRTSPVLRGKWILEVLLGDRVPPPPPDVPALKVDEEAVTAVSLREELEAHRTQSECAACHNRMDPLGFGLENFDALGRWRSEAGGQPINATGKLPSGEEFTGPEGLKNLLMRRKDKVIEHLATKMTGYAFGRGLNKFDQCVINDAMNALKASDYRASVLIEQIAASFPFRHRYYPNTTAEASESESGSE